jgi:hypothetical protein
MNVSVKIDEGTGTCKHKKVTLTTSEGKTYTRVFTEEEIMDIDEHTEYDIWKTSIHLIRQEAKRAKDPTTIGEVKQNVEAGDYKI